MIVDDLNLKSGASPDAFAKWNRDIVSLFEEQVRRAPEATALVSTEDELEVSYIALNERANRLARHLSASGVTPGSFVGICLERSFDAIAGVLAILKNCATYVPIDPQYPPERISFILKDSSATSTLTRSGIDSHVREAMVGPVFIDDPAATEAYESSNLGVNIPPGSPAYVMYTSGTTGTAKGVAVPHSGISRLVKHANYIDLDETDVVLHHSTCAFDAATFEMWAALLNGGTLVIHRPSFDLDTLGRVVRDYGVTTLLLTTSVFHLVAEHKPDCFATLKKLVTGGDVMHAKIARKVIGRYPHLSIVNGCGPTENTTFTCCYVITRETRLGETVPIGKPISGTNVFILDENLKRVQPGEVGQLYTNGLGLARRYLNRPDLTEQYFIECPFPETGDVLYRTGDLVREDSDGNIHFIGRRDRQVKIRGFRVEPGEIEHAINARSDVAESVVVAEETNPTEKHLVAYVKRADASSALDASEIKHYLAAQLPHYMVPAEIHLLDDFPLTSNGKIDKDRLRTTVANAQDSPAIDVPLVGCAQVVLDVWRKQLRAPSLQIDGSIYDHGASSLTIMVVQNELNEQLRCTADPIELARAQTPLEWAGIYDRRLCTKNGM